QTLAFQLMLREMRPGKANQVAYPTRAYRGGERMSSMRVPILWRPRLAELRSAPIRFGRTTKMRLLGVSLVIAGSVSSATSAQIALPDPSAAPTPTAKAATPNVAPNPAPPPFTAEM